MDEQHRSLGSTSAWSRLDDCRSVPPITERIADFTKRDTILLVCARFLNIERLCAVVIEGQLISRHELDGGEQ
jgi:hypothetical protein